MDEQKEFAIAWGIVFAMFCAFVVIAVHIVTSLNSKQTECDAKGMAVKPSRSGEFICVVKEGM